MCGIVLMMSDDKLIGANSRIKAFTQGVVIDTLRGPHSTGLVYTDYDGSAEIYKKPIPGYDFVSMPKYNAILDDVEDYPFMIAHNRWATKGKVNTANAHPFQHGHITGVHNGSLWSYKSLAPDQDFDTDSEYIIHALANNDVGDVLGEIDGAFVLAWHNSISNTMHIARNDERPFHLAHIKGSKTVLGASELEMLDLMCARNSLVVEEKYQVNTEVELIFRLDDLHNPEVLERPMREPFKQQYGNGYNTGKKTSGVVGGSSTTTIPSTPHDVTGIMTTFVNYPNSTWGYIEGLDSVDPYTPIRINGYQESEIGAIDMKDECFSGSVVVHGKGDDGEEYLSVLKNSVKWLTTEEAYPPTPVKRLEDSSVGKLFYSRKNTTVLFTRGEAEEHLKFGCSTCGDMISIEDYNTIDWWNDWPICQACEQTDAISRI